MPHALDDIRVLDLSRVLAGPWATQVLADLGADVIKVERPGDGDDTRRWGPPFVTGPDGAPGDAAYYFAANRNKRCVTIDFTRPAGADLVRTLAARSHVFVENFRTGGLAKYGLDYASLRTINPTLVYCSITGFGQDGPYARRAGYDYLIQGMGGLMSITGQPDGAPGAEPMKVGVAVADLFAGMYAVTGILGALRHAERTGEGQQIDIALLDCQVAMLANQAMNWFVGGQAPTRLGNAHPNVAPYQVFRTADAFLILAIGNDGQFRTLCAHAGREDLIADARFATNAGRIGHRDALTALLAPLLATRTTDAWIAGLDAVGVPCGRINAIDQVFSDPQVAARGLAQTLPRAGGAAVTAPASPLKMSATPPRAAHAAPPLGADTEAVLRTVAELDPAAIDRLRASGAI
ncbi:MAG: CaiB/BaiF CoA-transferase family protein [Hyphomonadaceae bacterium]|nr:CaiB/BaiF CoA-transferase family protein [Hyphomonadaceae bacterium]